MPDSFTHSTIGSWQTLGTVLDSARSGFGKRHNSAPVAQAKIVTFARELPAIGLGLLVCVLALGLYALPTLFGPAPHDLSPGAKFDVGPYSASAGCPSRRWSVGEWLPAACILNNDFTRTADLVGLEPIRRQRREQTTRAWVRNGPDALAVVCMPFCRINKAVRDRFVNEPNTAAPHAADRWQALHPSTPLWLRLLPLSGPLFLAGYGIFLFVREMKKRAAARSAVAES